jgi:hypothetical protein
MDPTPSLSPGTNQEEVLKRNIESVENSTLDSEDKFDLALLLVSDKKQGAYLSRESMPITSEEQRIRVTKEFEKTLSAILELLKKTGLSYRVIHELSYKNGYVVFSVIVSKDKNVLDKFAKANNEQDQKTFGLIVGYPKTATETYHTDKQFRFRQELPPADLEKLKAEGVIPFISFMPSREHWTEELEYARENQRLIRVKAPKLYQELVSQTQ